MWCLIRHRDTQTKMFKNVIGIGRTRESVLPNSALISHLKLLIRQNAEVWFTNVQMNRWIAWHIDVMFEIPYPLKCNPWVLFFKIGFWVRFYSNLMHMGLYLSWALLFKCIYVLFMGVVSVVQVPDLVGFFT